MKMSWNEFTTAHRLTPEQYHTLSNRISYMLECRGQKLTADAPEYNDHGWSQVIKYATHWWREMVAGTLEDFA